MVAATAGFRHVQLLVEELGDRNQPSVMGPSVSVFAAPLPNAQPADSQPAASTVLPPVVASAPGLLLVGATNPAMGISGFASAPGPQFDRRGGCQHTGVARSGCFAVGRGDRRAVVAQFVASTGSRERPLTSRRGARRHRALGAAGSVRAATLRGFGSIEMAGEPSGVSRRFLGREYTICVERTG